MRVGSPYLGLLCLAAVVVEFSCLTWGLDQVSSRGVTWHPDEEVIVNRLRYMIENRTVCPGRYDWPSLHFTLTAIPSSVALALGDDSRRTGFLIERTISALSGVAAVVLIALITQRLFAPRAAILAGVCALLNGFAFLCSHYGTPHMLATALGLASLLCAAKYLIGSEKEARRALPAMGLLAGLCIGAQYNGVFWALMLPMVVFARGWRVRAERGLFPLARCVAPALLLVALCLVIGFLVATPAALLEPGSLYAGIRFQWQESSLGAMCDGIRLRPAHADIWGYSSVAVSTGLPTFMLILWGLGVVLRAQPTDAPGGRCLALWFIVGLALLGRAHRGVAPHHVLPVAAAACIFAGVGMDHVLRRLERRPPLGTVVIGLALAWQAALLALVVMSFCTDTRNQATSWMLQQWRTRKHVAVFLRKDHHYVPTIPPYAQVLYVAPQLRGGWAQLGPYLDYCVVASAYYERWLDYYEVAPGPGAFFEDLLTGRSGFVVERVFRRPGLQSDYRRVALRTRPTGAQTLARNLRRAATLDADPGFASPTVIILKRRLAS